MDLSDFYKRYPQKKVDKAMEILTYKKVDTLPKEESISKPIIYIFSHGQSIDNSNFVFSGWRDCDITQKGVEQAEILAPKLKDKRIDMLISSDQIRAINTMKIAMSQNESAKNLKLRLDPRIKERSYGLLQGYSKIELFLWNEPLFHAFHRDYDVIPPEGENLRQVCERVKNFCNEIVTLMKTLNINIAISCHGNSIRGFRQYFEHLSDTQTAAIETPLGQDYASYIIE